MCINVVNFQTTKKTTKKQHEHDQASKDTKLHALSFTGSMFMNGHVVLTGVQIVLITNSPVVPFIGFTTTLLPLKLKKKMEKMNFIRTPHKAFFTIHTIILIAQGFVKHAGNKIQAFQGHEQAQNDDAWRKTLKSLQSKKKTFKIL